MLIQMRALRAFTLLELLVAMSVIAILSGLALSALCRAKAKAQAISCRSNLRQWGQATQWFAANNGDYLPQDGAFDGSSTNEGWYNDLPLTLGLPTYKEMPWHTNAHIDLGHSIWICPSNPRRSNGHELFHYCLNKNVNGDGTGNQIRLGSVPRPSVTVWLFDNGGIAGVAQQNNVHTCLHNKGAQFVFLDGHAARFNNIEYWNFKTGKGITNNPELVWFP
jgi:prepilin-type N-terminal cleavage/methylation domain-containing protein/prepilin-type processing-associated H-X9-DG protein